MANTDKRKPQDQECLELLEKGIPDDKAHRRLLKFINGATNRFQLQVAPHDRVIVDEDFHHSEHADQHPEEKKILPLEVAEAILKARNFEQPAFGFGHLRDLVRIDERLIDRLQGLLSSFGPANYGRWDMLYDLEVDGVPFEIEHAALTRTYDVVFLADGTNTLIWDPADETTPQFNLLSGATTGLTANLLCGGHSFLSDGKLLVVGGGGFGPGTPTSDQGWKFDPVANTWQRTANDMSTRRWYPTVLTLGHEAGPTGASGRAMIAAGHSAGGPVMEIYSEASDSFQTVTVSGAVQKSFPQTYPALSLLPGGEVFYTPTGFGNCGTGSVYALNDPAAYFTFSGVASGSWTEVGPAMNRTKGMAAIVLQSTYPYVRVIVVGGGETGNSSTAQTINLSTLSPSWSTPSTIPDTINRINVGTVLLPDGTLLVSGGTQSGPHTSWIYNPSTPVNQWQQMDELNAPRHYHSCLLLLPSGKIMAAGGAASGGCTASVENTIEVFSPPYLFNSDGTSASRPSIAAIDGIVPTKLATLTVHHGASFVITTSEADDIARVVLVRPMAVTHQTDTEQRVIECSFIQSGAETLTGMAPDGGHPHSLAPRGYYMLFLINTSGTPSEAAFIHLH